MDTYSAATRDVALLLLIIGGAGALKEVLVASGAGGAIAAGLHGTGLPPLVLGWLLAGLIRVCLGSATVRFRGSRRWHTGTSSISATSVSEGRQG